ncbi:MAG: hypothetical protein CMI54_01980 [Parcubacteria group bacterium]|nr:hypothetical protein [Parcubacteria group bacterium]|tara:strand:+ start:2522 stop:3658 length:1137 start_codon:yes stop_codon:yes gene_type:complete
MAVTKRRRVQENYEDYWKITLEYTNIDDWRFLGTLKTIKEFIDENSDRLQSKLEEDEKKLFRDLQEKVDAFNPKQKQPNGEISPSVRKAINQFVKLGFVNYRGRGYHPDVEHFLNAKSDEQRRISFSKIVYENSNFQSSWTKDDKKKGHIKFLIKTLEELNSLDYSDILGLMKVDIDSIEDGYLTRNQLDLYIAKNRDADFRKRKYNQLSHFRSILRRLDRLTVRTWHPDGLVLMFEKFADDQFPDHWRKEGRDPYLQNIYRRSLMQEILDRFGSVICMVSGKSGEFIASHIKPFSRCKECEAYDPNNGLLLIKEIDAKFDKGRITFDQDGVVRLREDFPPQEKNNFEDLKINPLFLNKKRLEYMGFHRKSIFGKERS